MHLSVKHGRLRPSVGVVIPAYNTERYLRVALQSVLAQTHGASSIVVVDDGSKDQTAAVAQSFGPPVLCLRQPNAGVAAARNRGAQALDTDWIAFLDADDFWKADKLRLQLEAAASTGAGAVFCALELVDEQGQPLESPDDTTSLELESLLLHRDCIPQGTSSTLLVRRDLFVSIGEYDERLATMADWDLLIRLRLQSTFAHVSRALAVYRRYAGTMSRNVKMLERESQLVLDKTFSNPALHPQLRRLERSCRAWNDLVLSGSHYHDGRVEAALRFGIRAVIRDPRLAMHALGFPWRVLKRRMLGGLPGRS